AGRERHRHQLGLVAQLGDEDDPEADRERREKTVHSSPLRSAGSGMDDLDPALSVRVEGLARPAACRAPWPGAIAPACRPRRWELLPLARSTLAHWHQRPAGRFRYVHRRSRHADAAGGGGRRPWPGWTGRALDSPGNCLLSTSA